MFLVSCGGGAPSPATAPVPQTAPSNQLTATDVQSIAQQAAQSVSAPIAIAVTDRGGTILGIYVKPATPATSPGDFGSTVNTSELAVALARTASFFSNNEAPLSSRTVRFISGVHFPPGISFTASAALYGIENTNRGCGFNTTFISGNEVPAARSIDGTQ